MADITISKINDTRLKATVRTSLRESELARQIALEKLQRKVELPGFRRGKVPQHIVKQKFAPELLLDSIQEAAILSLAQLRAKSEHGLYNIISVENVDASNETFTFDIIFDLPPFLKPAKIKEATIREHIFQITERDYEEQLHFMRMREATYEDKSTPAEKGDRVIFDYEVLVDGVPVGNPITNRSLLLGEEHNDREVENKILESQATPGTEIRFEKTPVKRAGEGDDTKPYTVILTVKKVQKVILPELTDEWIQRNSNHARTLAELKDEIRQSLEDYFNKKSLEIELQRAFVQFEKASEFFFSESYLNDEAEKFLRIRQIPAEEVTPEQMRELKKSIEKSEKRQMVIAYFILEAKKNKNSEHIREGFRKSIEKDLSADRLNYIMSLYDAYTQGKSLKTNEFEVLESVLKNYYYQLIKEYLDAQGFVKKGKKMTMQELIQELN